MNAPSCLHESDVLDLVAIGQWPARADETLRAHVAGCGVCRDLAAVAAAVGGLADQTRLATRVPDASVVWLRARLRARHESARRAARPVLFAQILGALVAVAVLVLALRSAGSLLPQSVATIASVGRVAADTAGGATASTVAALRWLGLFALGLTGLIAAVFSIANLADRAPAPPRR
jgi:hypothetical protein